MALWVFLLLKVLLPFCFPLWWIICVEAAVMQAGARAAGSLLGDLGLWGEVWVNFSKEKQEGALAFCLDFSPGRISILQLPAPTERIILMINFYCYYHVFNIYAFKNGIEMTLPKYMHTHTHPCTHTCTHIHTHAHAYTHMHTHTHPWTHIDTHAQILFWIERLIPSHLLVLNSFIVRILKELPGALNEGFQSSASFKLFAFD